MVLFFNSKRQNKLHLEPNKKAMVIFLASKVEQGRMGIEPGRITYNTTLMLN